MSHFCFSLACDLKEDVPNQIIDTLKYMIRTQDYKFDDPPDDPFFENDEWRTCLLCDNDGSSFPGEAGRSFRSVYRFNRSQDQGGAEVYRYTLSFRCESLDDAIVAFLLFAQWLAPYSATQGFVGYWIYENAESPQLLYFNNGLLHISEPATPYNV